MKKIFILSLMSLMACVMDPESYPARYDYPSSRPFSPKQYPPQAVGQGRDFLKISAAGALKTSPKSIKISKVNRSADGTSFEAITADGTYQCFKNNGSRYAQCNQ